MAEDTTRQILRAAERRARQAGYGGFSFREIADEIGIKSASVHYHFPTKAALGVALVRDYTDRFMTSLGAPDDAPLSQLLSRFADQFRHALQQERLMCLCGMLGSEIAALPNEVAAETRGFFRRNLEWLAAAYGHGGLTDEAANIRAAQTLAALEGAMIVARSMGDLALFDRVADNLAIG